jgi:hypothetical protein
MCALIFIQTLFKTLLIIRILQGNVVISVETSLCKVPVIRVRFQ